MNRHEELLSVISIGTIDTADRYVLFLGFIPFPAACVIWQTAWQMERIFAFLRVSVPVYLIVRAVGSLFKDGKRVGVQTMAASPCVAALEHFVCGRLSDNMGACRAAKDGKADTQQRFHQTGTGYAARRHMLFCAVREREAVQQANGFFIPHNFTE
ncbi:MAG: hypothetical protein PUF49_06255 [Firmicutes bacterium]|nr:hypothetical protein [Bacillota bacterium]